jgi:hypothetical protein
MEAKNRPGQMPSALVWKSSKHPTGLLLTAYSTEKTSLPVTALIGSYPTLTFFVNAMEVDSGSNRY